MKKRKRDRKKDTTEYLIINQHWTKPCCHLDDIDRSDYIYYFDKEKFDFIKKSDISDIEINDFDKETVNRYVKLFQFINASQYKSLVQLLNKPYVTSFFSKALTEEEAHHRYYDFLDWNNLYEAENYRLYISVSKLMVEWCEKNDIRYKFIPFTPPKKYIYNDEKNLKAKDWAIPHD